MSVERDIIERLGRAGVGYHVTGSEALALWAEPRQTLDIGIVTDLAPEQYDTVIRPAFEDAYLVNDLIMVDGRGYGSLIHRTEVHKADLIMRRSSPRQGVRPRLGAGRPSFPDDRTGARPVPAAQALSGSRGRAT